MVRLTYKNTNLAKNILDLSVKDGLEVPAGEGGLSVLLDRVDDLVAETGWLVLLPGLALAILTMFPC